LLATILLASFWPFTERRVTQSFSETFPGKLTIARYHYHWFPHPGCVAEDVTFLPKTPSGDSATVISARRITIRADYHVLLLRPGHIARVLIEGLRVQVPAAGSRAPLQNPSPSRVVLAEVIADGAVLEIARHGKPPLNFQVTSLRLYSLRHASAFSYEAVFRNPLPPGEIRSSGRFGPWNEVRPAATPASGTYSFQRADLSVFHGIAGFLSSDGRFAGTLEHLDTQGNIDIPDFEVTRSGHSVPLAVQYHSVVNAADGDVTLTRVDALVLKTKVLATGSVAARQGEGGKFTMIDLTVNQGRIQDALRVFAAVPQPPLNGSASFRAHVAVPPGDHPFLEKVVLFGDFGVQEGQFTHPDTQQSVADLSTRGAGKKPEDPEAVDPRGLVSDLSGHVELRNGMATFSEFRFQVPDARADMHGTYDLFSEKVDLHGILRTTAKFSETTSGFKSLLLKPFDAFFKRKHGGGKVPVKLTGTYSHPEPGLDLIK